MKVTLLSKRDAPMGFYYELTQQSEATPFHTIDWLSLMEKIIPNAKTFFVVIEDEGEPIGMMPLIIKSRGPFKWLYSLPYGTYGGFLLKLPIHLKPFASELLKVLQPKGGVAWIGDFNNSLPPLTGFQYKIQMYHFIELENGYDFIWEKVYNYAQRNSQRVARKRGVVVRKIQTHDELREFYDMYVSTIREKSTVLFTFEQLKLMMDHLQPSGMFRGFLAYIADEPIAGVVNLFHKSMTVGFLQGSKREFLHLRPVNMLIDESIKDAINMGSRIFNLGVTPKNVEGVLKFKESFGAKRGYFPVQMKVSLLYKLAKALLQ